MRIRFRIGPFTFGKSGMRLSPWRGGTGFSIPIFNRKARSYGKIKLGMFSFFFGGKPKNRKEKRAVPQYIEQTRATHKQAYEPWTNKADKELVSLFRKGKTVKELSEIFGRTQGAIRSRINKLLME